MANKQKYISSIGFTDLLFNIVVGLAFLFILAFVLINPISKEKVIFEAKLPEDISSCISILENSNE